MGTGKPSIEAGFTGKLASRPWLALLLMILSTIVIAFFVGMLIPSARVGSATPLMQFVIGMIYHLLLGFIIAPLIFRLPRGKQTYRQYLTDIGFTPMRPFFRLVILAIACYVILALCQISASIIWRLIRGGPLTISFLRYITDISGDLPPASASLLVSLPSIFEEVDFRGVVLQTFRNKVTDRQAILFSSLGFGMIHLVNLLNPGTDPLWVLGQVGWAVIMGVFYANITLKTGSLLPAMIVHYLGNAFIGSLTGYLQATAPVGVEILMGITMTMGIVPVTLMILLTNAFACKYLRAA